MKRFYINLLGISALAVMSAGVCNAQSPGTLALKAPAAAIVVDGASNEWGDSLAYYNKDAKIHYSISNDKTTLYLIVKAKDPVQENNILMNGLTFSVDMKGRKKSTLVTTFPTASPNGMGGGGVKPNATVDEKRLSASVTKFKKITVDGYKDISDETITTANTYGIKTAVGYDNDGTLVYEEAIPLELFHAGDLAKGEWAFNIKLNGHEASADADPNAPSAGGGGGRGGKGGGRRTDQSSSNAFFANAKASSPTIDFWGKFTLAQ